MIEPSSSALEALSHFTVEAFATWLRDGIRCHLFEVDVSPAFEGAQDYIGLHDTLVEDLVAIHGALPAHVQTAFEDGAARALARLDFTSASDAQVARQLMLLAGRIRAHGVLSMFARSAHQGFEGERGSELLSLALDLIGDLATPGDEAVRASLRSLAAAKGFSPLHARRALPALCVIAPRCLAAHLELLHRHLQERYGPWACSETQTPAMWRERRDLVRRVLELVRDPEPLAEAAAQWWQRASLSTSLGYTALDEDWWLAAWIKDSDAAIVAARRSLGRAPAASTPRPPPTEAYPSLTKFDGDRPSARNRLGAPVRREVSGAVEDEPLVPEDMAA